MMLICSSTFYFDSSLTIRSSSSSEIPCQNPGPNEDDR